METITKKSVNFLLAFGMLVFFIVAFFSTAHGFDMEVLKDGTMKGCLFTGKTENCTMSLSEHVNSWQDMFTATTPQQANVLILLVVTALLYIAVFKLEHNLISLLSYYANRWRLYLKNSGFSIRDYLREELSQGILNPKIYNSVN